MKIASRFHTCIYHHKFPTNISSVVNSSIVITRLDDYWVAIYRKSYIIAKAITKCLSMTDCN